MKPVIWNKVEWLRAPESCSLILRDFGFNYYLWESMSGLEGWDVEAAPQVSTTNNPSVMLYQRLSSHNLSSGLILSPSMVVTTPLQLSRKSSTKKYFHVHHFHGVRKEGGGTQWAHTALGRCPLIPFYCVVQEDWRSWETTAAKQSRYLKKK